MEQSTFHKEAIETAELLEALDLIIRTAGPMDEKNNPFLGKRRIIAQNFLAKHIKVFEALCLDHSSQEACSG